MKFIEAIFGARLRLAPWLAALVLLALPTAAQAAGSAYVVSQGSGGAIDSVSQYSIGADGRLSPLSPVTVAAGLDSREVAVTPNGRSVYITGNPVFQYSVDPGTGALSPKVPASVAMPPGTLSTTGIAIAPNGKSAYMTGSEPHGGSHILQYDIDPLTGALSLKTPNDVSAGFVSIAVAVTPDGRSLYSTDVLNAALQYDIDPVSGALSPKTPRHVRTGGHAEAVAVSPDGRSAYFINFHNKTPNNTVAQFDIDPVSGALSPKTPPIVVTGPKAQITAITPDGKSAYVTTTGLTGSPGSGSVWQYDLDPVSGVLSSKSPATVATGGSAYGVAVTSDGKTAYVTNPVDSTVWQYDIDSVSGGLSPKTPSTIAVAGTASSVAVGPLPRVPTGKEQCNRGGWRNFPQFKNQGQCVGFVEHANGRARR